MLRISAGARIFLQRVADNDPLGEAAGAAFASGAGFDLVASLAALFSGLAIAMTSTHPQGRRI